MSITRAAHNRERVNEVRILTNDAHGKFSIIFFVSNSNSYKSNSSNFFLFDVQNFMLCVTFHCKAIANEYSGCQEKPVELTHDF